MTKVLPTAKVAPPNGPIGKYPQTSAPNPSQRNGMSPPKVSPVQRDLGDVAPFHPDTSQAP
jgi:hypothetical protein